ncbi:SIR2 family protein [Rhodococcus erythropolis]|uniref:SIR2 family protein n=1 Tax=Rhodococcus erythropolis TaxID=1833 RepID=UPI00294A5F52|nr:SIR2 family protein [Rhodococcus erythropolis]MDV6211876.1 SIR2 family protein [Rhodococcus erythropolis]
MEEATRMTLVCDDVYSYVQGLFRSGLVIVVGSGASCAYGLPSMGTLAEQLIEEVPSWTLQPDSISVWDRIVDRLTNGDDLETALGPDVIPEDLAEVVTGVISNIVGGAEAPAIEKILTATTESALGRLFKHALRATNYIDVITTNYDRLLEIHAARADVRVDTMFYGHTIGRLDPKLSKEELLTSSGTPGRGRSTRTTARPHIRLSKPHGSLDWYAGAGTYFRTDLVVSSSKQIIAPGGNKYRLGYGIPFEAQRGRANAAVTNSSAMLFIGYGFNDEHLQTHLKPKMSQVPSVLVAKKLTDSAHEYLKLNSMAIGIEEDPATGGCTATRNGESLIIAHPLWDIESLSTEVLGI